MKIRNPEKRLKKFYGKVDRKHINSFLPYIRGGRILDLGCGNGSTTALLLAKYPESSCVGVDFDAEEVNKAKELYPAGVFVEASAEDMPFEADTFDTIVLRDALHHLYEEADFEKIAAELKRVAKENALIIIFDPNINFILKTARFFAAHNDAECNFETACSLLEKMGVDISVKTFNTLYSLPLSGGYVGINFVPDIKFVQSFILSSEHFFEKLVNWLRLGRYLCWRYLIVGEMNNERK